MTIRRTRIIYTMGNLPERWHRRLVRSALHSLDPNRLRLLVSKGLDVNLPISDVFWDTPLTYSVKAGYLEMVECLVVIPRCNVDLCNRNKKTALDEAVCAWLLGATSNVISDYDNATTNSCKNKSKCELTHKNTTKQLIGKRYRILRCLLAAGATQMSLPFLDMLIFSALTTTRTGYAQVAKLVRVVCEKGSTGVKSSLLSVLVPYPNTAQFIWMLIKCGAVPQAYLNKSPGRPFMPLDNAILLLKACNHPKLLRRIDSDTGGQLDTADWSQYKIVLKLLTLSGHKVQSHVMNYCYKNHADVYAWMARYCRSPQRLSHLCRIIVRQHLSPSVPVAMLGIAGVEQQDIPATLKQCLLFERIDELEHLQY